MILCFGFLVYLVNGVHKFTTKSSISLVKWEASVYQFSNIPVILNIPPQAKNRSHMCIYKIVSDLHMFRTFYVVWWVMRDDEGEQVQYWNVEVIVITFYYYAIKNYDKPVQCILLETFCVWWVFYNNVSHSHPESQKMSGFVIIMRNIDT